jgi:hypothetical protein
VKAGGMDNNTCGRGGNNADELVKTHGFLDPLNVDNDKYMKSI